MTGATHIYLRQRYRGLPVYNAQLHVNVNRDGRIISVNNSFLPGLQRGGLGRRARARPAARGATARRATSASRLGRRPARGVSGARASSQAATVEPAGVSRAADPRAA